MIVDRLFAAAELSSVAIQQKIVRIVRTDGRPSHDATARRSRASTNSAPAAPSEMRLRAGRPPVTRLSRKVLIGLGAVAGLRDSGRAVSSRFKPHRRRRLRTLQHDEPIDAGRSLRPAARLLRIAARAPKLGPPLPGDLGRPILNAGVPRRACRHMAHTTRAAALTQEQEAARTSRLFATTNAEHCARHTRGVTGCRHKPLLLPLSPRRLGRQVSHDHKLAFLNAATDRQTQSAPIASRPSPARNVLQAGSIIPAALITGLAFRFARRSHCPSDQDV